MKKYLALLAILLISNTLKAQDDDTRNLNNKASYSRYYDSYPRFLDKYPGGVFQYLSENIQYPKNTTHDISGQINIHVIIDTTGTMSDPLIVRSVSPEVDQAVLDAMANAPKFQPAVYKGHLVPVFLAVVMNVSVNVNAGTITAARDVQNQLKEMELARRNYDVAPKFPYENDNFYKYIADNIKYPDGVKTDVNAIIDLRFKIDTTGAITDVAITKNISKEVDQAVLDVLAGAPKFIPATYKGKKVRVPGALSLSISVNTTNQSIIAKNHIVVRPPAPGLKPAYSTIPGENTIFTAVEISPEYPGGEQAFARYLQQNIKYPAYAKLNHVQGRVYIQFVVERDGSLTDIKSLRAPSDDLANEAIRVMQTCPHWKPGIQNGKPVRVQYTIPINFAM